MPSGAGRTLLRLPVAVLVLLLLGACGDGNETASPPSPSPQATVEPDEPAETDVADETLPPVECTDETITGNVEVTIRETDNAFSPQCLVVLGGQGLEIVNRGTAVHNFSIEGTAVDLDTPPGEATRTEPLATVIEAGTHEFVCKYHVDEGMRGEITLTEAG